MTHLPIVSLWIFASTRRLARAGPPLRAPGGQLGALVRRHRLSCQQQQLRCGADYQSRPPYPSRPRPPS